MSRIEGRLLYFNIDYDCNNDCVFCAAGSRKTRTNRREMKASQISKALDRRNVGSGDIVVVNGGEPTVHPEIIPILEDASSRGSFVYLFSNGLKFSEANFAYSIVAAGVNRIAIPIYSHIADTHDLITRHKGSFADTIRGINNLFSIREQTRHQLEIELKSLVSMVNINHLPYVARMVVERFPETDHFLLSSMYVSDAVISSMPAVVPRLSRCTSVLRKSIDIAVSGGIDVCLYYIPLCILKDPKYAILCNKDKYRSDKDPDVYFDSSVPHGIRLDTDSAKGENCFRCSFDSNCDGIWRSYAKEFGFEDLCPIALYDH
jgi:organic radical activating enzyme